MHKLEAASNRPGQIDVVIGFHHADEDDLRLLTEISKNRAAASPWTAESYRLPRWGIQPNVKPDAVLLRHELACTRSHPRCIISPPSPQWDFNELDCSHFSPLDRKDLRICASFWNRTSGS